MFFFFFQELCMKLYMKVGCCHFAGKKQVLRDQRFWARFSFITRAAFRCFCDPQHPTTIYCLLDYMPVYLQINSFFFRWGSGSLHKDCQDSCELFEAPFVGLFTICPNDTV